MYFPTEPTPVYPGLASCMALLAVMGCAVQILLLLMLTRTPFQQFDLTPYFLSVVLGNLMVIGADLPPLVASAWSHKQLVGIAYCQVGGFLTGVWWVTTGVTMALAVRAVYLNMCDEALAGAPAERPRDSWQYDSIIKKLTGVWLYAIAVGLPPVFGWGSFEPESGDIICAPNWRESSISGRSYLSLLVSVAFLIPLGFSIAYLIKMYQRSKQDPDEDALVTRNIPKEKKTVVLTSIGIVFFFGGWTPYCTCALISVFGGSEMLGGGKSFIPGMFAKASYVFLPILCIFLSKRFQTAGRELFYVFLCCMKKKTATDDDDDNDADVNNNAWGQFVITRRRPEQVMSRIRRMRYPRPSYNDNDDRHLALTAFAFESPDNDQQKETSV